MSDLDNVREIEELRESELKFRTVVEQAGDAFQLVDEQGYFIEVNENVCRQLGYTRDELLKMGVWDIVPELNKEDYSDRFKARIGKPPVSFEISHRRKDGSIFPVEVNVATIKLKDRYRAVVFVRDITERKRAQDSLAEKEKEFYSIFDNTWDALMISEAPSWRFLAGNKAAVKLFGCLDEAEFISYKPWDLSPEFQSDGRPSSEKAVEMIGLALQKGYHYFEWTHKKITGEIFPATVLLTWIKTGKGFNLLGTVRDISLQKKHEEFLVRENNNLQLIFDSSQVGLLLIDSKREVKRFNKVLVKMFGRNSSDILKESRGEVCCMHRLFKGETAGQTQVCKDCSIGSMIGLAINKGQNVEGVEVEREIVQDDKKVRVWLNINVTSLEIDSEMHILLSIIDVTLRKRAEMELRRATNAALEANKAKNDFLANMSHEIRTPMNAILGFSSLLQSTSLDEKQKSYLDAVTANSGLLLGVINDVLDFSKLEVGEVVLQKIDFNLSVLINDIFKVAKLKSKNKLVNAVICQEGPLSQWVKGDPARLSQVLLNLLGNAFKFTEHGEICLTVSLERNSAEGSLVRFCVKDTGIGIPNEKKDKLFESFTQVDSSTTRKYGGTGLGLAISKKLVLAMGGQIWFESQEGKGSEFYFTLPFSTGIATDNALGNIEGVAFKGLRVLVVDDSMPNRQLMKAVLDRLGVTSDYAKDGQEAVEKVKVFSYDICLMDLQMPVMDGVQATRIIRADINKELPIVALTANIMQKDVESVFEAGMNDFLAKPVDLNKLKAVFRKYWIKQS